MFIRLIKNVDLIREKKKIERKSNSQRNITNNIKSLMRYDIFKSRSSN